METPPATPPAAPQPLQLSSESGMVWNVNRTEPFHSDVDIVEVHPMVISSSMESLKFEFQSILTRITASSAVRETDHVYGDTRSMAGSASLTNTTVSSHDLVEAAETAANDSQAIYDLWRIAERMRSDGYVSECIQVYMTVRKAFLYKSLQSFGIERQSTNDVQNLFSNELEKRIERCVRVCNASFSILFPAELKLCEQIFEGEERSACYHEMIEESLAQLIGYADSLISGRRVPELLFKYLDLHEALVDLLSERIHVDPFYRHQRIINDLARKIRRILSDFEKLVINEMATSKAEGGIASLTEYVMRYLARISEYKDILTDLIVLEPAFCDVFEKNIPDVKYAQVADRTPLDLHVVYVVVLLRFKIERKSRHYYKADSAKSYPFLIDNLAHIIQSIRQSPKLEEMIGISYMNKLRDSYLKQVMMKYQRKTCDNMLRCLRNNNALRCFPGVGLSTNVSTFKRKIESFYAMLEDARSNQARWAAMLVTDEELYVPVEHELVISYTEFLERYKASKDGQNVADYLVKYSPYQIETSFAMFSSMETPPEAADMVESVESSNTHL